MAEEQCAGCGRPVEGGTAGCNESFVAEGLRAASDVAYGRLHQMVVDAYCLQHPERYCISAKSLAAHLCGLCHQLEFAGSRAMPFETLRRWLDGAGPGIVKPPLPAARGDVTIAALTGVDDPESYAAAVEQWARSAWMAYAPLHGVARDWLAAARAAGQRRR